MGTGIQVGVGANQVWSPTDMNAFGAGAWFEWAVVSQPTNQEYSFLPYTGNFPTDINILLSGVPTPPCDPPITICDNVTSGGTIGSNQTICAGATPALLTSLTPPSGGTGALEYVWLKSTTGCPTMLSQAIPGTNSATYQPGPLTVTTYYRRCARRAGCTDYIGESNCVTIVVVPDVTPPTITGCPGNQVLTAQGTCAIATWTAPTATDNCSVPTLTSNYNSGHCFPVGATTVVYTATDAAGLTKTCTFTVTVDPAPCLVSINITDKVCNSNGTPNNPNDDTYTFTMTVVGAGNISGTWSGGYSNAYLGAFAFAPTPYNTPITLGPFPAGPFTPGNVVPPITLPNGVDIQINVNDTGNPNCSQNTTVVSPGPCSAITGPNCDDVTFAATPGTITVGGLTAPIVMVQVFNTSNWSTAFSCAGNCNTPTQVIDNLPAGNYFIKVTFLTAGWNPICVREITIDVPPPGIPCNISLNVSNKVCNNNGTPADPNDDTYTFDITVTGTGTSGSWSGSFDNAYLGVGVLPPSPYNTPVTLGPFPAGPFTPGNVVPPIVLPNGVDIHVQVNDTQNSTCSASTVVTSTGPCSTTITMICTPGITVTTSPGNTTAVVNYNPPTATTTCPGGAVNMALLNGPASGSNFPMGVTTVCYSATDNCGNSTSCCFTVTVNPPPCIERVVTNNIVCNGSTAYGLWINGNHYSTSSNVRFRQYSNGTATLTGNFTRSGETVAVNVTFTNYSDTGTPYYELCVNSGGAAWDFYTDFSGTLSINGTSYAVTPRGPHLFQIGTGANLNEPSQFGASTWFYLNNSIHGDFNFRLGPAGDCTTTTVCDNVTSGGTIGKTCANGSVSLTSVSLPSGGSGAIEYVWMKGTSSCSVSSMTAVPNSNSATLTVASPAVNTYYIRCARRAGCTEYIGESNCITVNANECTTTNCTGNVLFVVGSTSLNGSDLALKNRLISLGYTVTVKSQSSATSSDASGKVLVLISESVTSTSVNTKFKSVTVPVMVLEPNLYDDMKMTGSTNFGTHTLTSMYVNASHPIAGGLSGNTTVYTSSQNASWGTPTSAASVIAYHNSYSYKKYVFVYAAGASMSGYTAPGKRIGFFVGSNCATYLTTNGWKLFDNSVKWATGCLPGGQNLQAELPISGFNATREFRTTRIEWASNTGYRNDYAVVERLNEATAEFEGIDYLETATGNHLPQVFTTYDVQPGEGDNFYRVRSVLSDGTEVFSEVKKVNFDGLDQVHIFPNPASEILIVDLTPYEGREVMITIYNQLGHMVQQVAADDATEALIPVDISRLPNGNYVVRVVSEGRRDVTRQVTILR